MHKPQIPGYSIFFCRHQRAWKWKKKTENKSDEGFPDESSPITYGKRPIAYNHLKSELAKFRTKRDEKNAAEAKDNASTSGDNTEV